MNQITLRHIRTLLLIVGIIFSFFENLTAQGIDTLDAHLDTIQSSVNKIEYLNRAAFDLRRTNIQSAKAVLDKSKELLLSNSNALGWANYHMVYGLIAKTENDFNKGITEFNLALKLFKEAKASNSISVIYNNLGAIFFESKKYDEAEHYYKSSITYLIKDDLAQHSIRYTNLGDVFIEKNKLDSALSYYLKAEEIEKKLNNAEGLYYCWKGLSNIESKNKNFEKAVFYLNKCLQLTTLNNDDYGLAETYLELSELHINNSNLKQAKAELFSAKLIAEKIGSPSFQGNALKRLSEIFKKEKNYPLALDYFKQANALNSQASKDALNNFLAESNAKQLDLEKSHRIETLKTDAEIEKGKNRIGIITGLSFLIILVYIILIIRKQKKNHALELEKNKKILLQKELIEYKNKQINRSLNYGLRIQSALLPSLENIKETFPNSFIYYKPKETVSGDIYWHKKAKDGDLLAIVDCTGHGVPGALVSILAISLLNSSVEDTNKPALFLSRLNTKLNQILKSASELGVRDGFEITLLQKDLQNNLHVSSSFQPWVSIHNKNIEDHKGDAILMGSVTGSFNTCSLSPSFKSVFLFSDGYFDQKGEKTNKKYFYSRFKQLLNSISEFNNEKQLEIITNEMTQWMGNLEQIDDMLIIGVNNNEEK